MRSGSTLPKPIKRREQFSQFIWNIIPAHILDNACVRSDTRKCSGKRLLSARSTPFSCIIHSLCAKSLYSWLNHAIVSRLIVSQITSGDRKPVMRLLIGHLIERGARTLFRGRAVIFAGGLCGRRSGRRGRPCARLRGLRCRPPAGRCRRRGPPAQLRLQHCELPAPLPLRRRGRLSLRPFGQCRPAGQRCARHARATRAAPTACRAACRSAKAGSFAPDRARNFSSSAFFAFAAAFSRSSKPVFLELSIPLHRIRDPAASAGRLGAACPRSARREMRRTIRSASRPFHLAGGAGDNHAIAAMAS